MRGGTVRVMTAAGILAVVMLSALGPSMAAAVEAAEDQPSAARHEPTEPLSEPAPPHAPPKRPVVQATVNPNPVRPDEPLAAPVIRVPGPAEAQPLAEGEPAAPKVQLVVAGATVSGIAAVAAWLVLGGRRREQIAVRTPPPPATG